MSDDKAIRQRCKAALASYILRTLVARLQEELAAANVSADVEHAKLVEVADKLRAQRVERKTP